MNIRMFKDGEALVVMVMVRVVPICSLRDVVVHGPPPLCVKDVGRHDLTHIRCSPCQKTLCYHFLLHNHPFECTLTHDLSSFDLCGPSLF
jgi:hypothetical protein